MSAIKEITQSVLQSFQKQLIETKAKKEQLLLENINLKKDLEMRWERISIILCKAISVDFALQSTSNCKSEVWDLWSKKLGVAAAATFFSLHC